MSDLLQAINAAVPAGYRAIHYRKPKAGEQFLNLSGKVATAEGDFSSQLYIILEREMQWPDWIKSGSWVFKLNNGLWAMSTDEPIWRDTHWGHGSKAICLYPEIFDTSWLPECSDWKESKRQKP